MLKLLKKENVKNKNCISKDWINFLQGILDDCKKLNEIDQKASNSCKVERSGCNLCGEPTDNENDNVEQKKYVIAVEDGGLSITGEGLYIHDNGDLQIFSDVRKGITKAYFKKWDFFTVGELEGLE